MATEKASPSATRRPATRTAPAWAVGRPRTVLLVHGLVPRQADGLRIRLETARGMELVVSPLDPTGHGHGDIVPFEATFAIAHRPTGADPPLFVVVVDGADRPLEAARHAYASSLFLDLRAIGRAVRPAPSATVTVAGTASRAGAVTATGPARSLGNDGLMGGIAFGIPFAERSGTVPYGD